MAKTNGNGSSKKSEIIKSTIHIEGDEPYVKLSFNPGTGSFGFDVKAKTLNDAQVQVNEIIDKYGHLMKTPKKEEIESFV